MEKAIRLRILGSLAVAAALALPTGSAMAAGSSRPCARVHVHRWPDIPSGNYASITVTGVCTVPAGAVISVVGNLNVAAGAVLDAQSAPSTITVGRNVTAAPGSLLGLGCQPPTTPATRDMPCAVEPDGHSTITVNGNVTATDADTVLLNGIDGQGERHADRRRRWIPWSIKNNTIGGNLTVSGHDDRLARRALQPDRRERDADQHHVTDVDPGAPGVSSFENTIGRNLNCIGTRPRACPEASSPASVNPSAATRPVSAQRWSDLVRTVSSATLWAPNGWRTGAAMSQLLHALQQLR